MQDRHSVRGFAGHDEGLGQADPGRDGGGVSGSQLAAAFGQYPLVPVNGFAGVPGGQVRGGQVRGHDQGVRVAGYQLGVAAGGEIPPVLNGRPDQARGVEAATDPQQ